jgi:hypothetical protein
MATVPVMLDYPAALSTGEVEKLSPGQAHWWVRRGAGGGDFVRLPRRVRGDQPLKLVVHLEPGMYIVGVGPAGSGVREELEVVASDDEAEAPEAVGPATLDVNGLTIVITGDFDAMDRDAAKAWLVGLGAKVVTSVSSKTNLLVVGRDPGQKKLEKAAELGTRTMSEAELRAALGVGAAPPPQAANKPAPPDDDPQGKVKQLLARLPVPPSMASKVEPIVGPAHFSDLGLHEHELWGIAVGPRGGQYLVYIDLNDRPKYALKCNCRDRDPCKHGFALLLTADRHFIPPVPPPEGHAEAARENYYSSWE